MNRIDVQRLLTLRRRLADDKPDTVRNLAVDYVGPMFECLQWSRTGTFSYQWEQEIRQDSPSALFLIADQPAFRLAVNRGTDPKGLPFAELVNGNYNEDVKWLVVSNFVQSRLYNILWYARTEWSDPFRIIEVSELEANLSLLWLLTPSGILNGTIDQYEEMERPDETKQPVDERLLKHLISCWEQLRRVGADVTGQEPDPDTRIHRFLNQLVFMRAAEDRNLQPRNTPSLGHLLTLRDDSFLRGFQHVMNSFRESFDSSLFDSDHGLSVPPSVLRQTVHGLYHVDEYGLRYDFSRIDSDILGEMYQRYLQEIEVEMVTQRGQQSLFPIVRVSTRHKRGAFYTPRALVDLVVKYCLDLVSEGEPLILDLSCGSGAFLVSAAKEVARRNELTSGRLRELVTKSIWGVDIDPSAVQVARLNLWLLLPERTDRLPDLSQNVIQGNSLLDEVHPTLEGKVDLILGNPPFQDSNQIADTDKRNLEGRFSLARGRFDVAHLFVEKAHSFLRPGGTAGLVLPGRFMRTHIGAPLRKFILERFEVVSLVDFRSSHSFEEVATTVSVAILRKKTANSESRCVSEAIIVNEPMEKGVPKATALLRDDSITWDIPGVERVSTRLPLSGSWLLLKSREERLLDDLRQRCQPLEAVATSFQGIRTGKNDVFVLDLVETKEGLYLCRGKAHQPLAVPDQIAKPFLLGRDIGRYHLRKSHRVLIYPYDADGDLIPIDELEDEFPDVFEYLHEHRTELEGRRSAGPTTPWYGLVRSRDTRTMFSPKIMTPDVSARPSFSVDERGEFAFASGVGMVPRGTEDLYLLCGILNSILTEWFMQVTSARYDQRHVSFRQQYLNKIPVPLDLNAEVRRQVSENARQLHSKYLASREKRSLEERLNRALARACGLGTDDLAFILENVAKLRASR